MPARFEWDPRVLRYREMSGGRFVSRETVRLALDTTLSNTERDALALSDDLRTGKIGLRAWRQGMRDLVKEAHLFSAAAAKGGRLRLTQSDYGRVGQMLSQGRGSMGQYQFLERFAGEIQRGLPLDGRFLQRVRMYVQAARSTYHRIDSLLHKALGFDEERNIRFAGDSCDGCIAAEARSWQPIGTLPPIGTRTCLANCQCSIIYRRSSSSGRRAA